MQGDMVEPVDAADLKTVFREVMHIKQLVIGFKLLHMPHTYAGDGKEALCPRAILWRTADCAGLIG